MTKQIDKVVIVLGKRLVRNKLSAEGRSRVEALVRALPTLCQQSTLLVFCGGVTEGQTVSEADAMHAYFYELMQSRGDQFPKEQILIENRSLNTLQNMQNAAAELIRSDFCHKEQLINVTLLSNDYHLMRIIEIQTLMDEQGLLRVLKNRCNELGVTLDIPLDINQHISVPYPNSGLLAEAFLLLDEITTYRVYLEGVKNGAFGCEREAVRKVPFEIARNAIKRLQVLPLDMDVQEQIAEMKKAIEMTAFDDSTITATRALNAFHSILTGLNRRLDPENPC